MRRAGGPVGEAATSTTERDRFERIYREHLPAVYGYFVRRTGSPDDASDLCGDTFLTVWRRLDSLPPGHEARLWIYGVARLVLANHRRGGQRRTRLTDRLATVAPHLGDPTSAAAVGSAAAEKITGIFTMLSPEDQDLLGLVAWENVTSNELAKVLGCSPGAARIRLHRARRRLQQALRAAGIHGIDDSVAPSGDRDTPPDTDHPPATEGASLPAAFERTTEEIQ